MENQDVTMNFLKMWADVTFLAKMFLSEVRDGCISCLKEIDRDFPEQIESSSHKELASV